MSNGPEIEALASPPTSEPWVPLWPLTAQPAVRQGCYAEFTVPPITSITGAVPTAVTASANARRFDTDGMVEHRRWGHQHG